MSHKMHEKIYHNNEYNKGLVTFWVCDFCLPVMFSSKLFLEVFILWNSDIEIVIEQTCHWLKHVDIGNNLRK